MKKITSTGNSIVIPNCYITGETVEEPVLRNGKPTKRTKKVWKSISRDEIADGYTVEGHEVFIPRAHFDMAMQKISNLSVYDYSVVPYTASGQRLMACCKFGKYGQKDHMEPVWLNLKTGTLFVSSRGYQGATGRGWGCSMGHILWEG